MKDHKIYSLEDVASALGVSKTTVSRAISGKGRIGEDTRARVLDFIETHDYRPNAVAKGFAQRKSYNIGLVLPMDYAMTDLQFFKEFTNGVCESAAEHEYDILITMQDRKSITSLKRLVQNRKVDGIILSRTIQDSVALPYIKESGIPFLVIGPSDDPEITSVDNRNREGGAALTGVIMEQGFRKIALFGGSSSHHVTKSRALGYEDAYRKRNETADPDLVFSELDTREKIHAALETAKKAEVDCIICMDDNISRMTVTDILERGWKIPEEIAVASMYDGWQLEPQNMNVTSVHYDSMILGRIACESLLQQIGDLETEIEDGRNYRIILRKSTNRSF